MIQRVSDYIRQNYRNTHSGRLYWFLYIVTICSVSEISRSRPARTMVRLLANNSHGKPHASCVGHICWLYLQLCLVAGKGGELFDGVWLWNGLRTVDTGVSVVILARQSKS